MNVSNINTYHNSIYTAVILEKDENNKILQVYIPSIHESLKSAFEAYIQDSNKSQSSYRAYFPWASTIVDGLEIGDMVYVTFVNNDVSNILIIGQDQAAAAGVYGGVGSGGTILVTTNGILDLAMPIILRNEVGLPLDAYPNNISNDYYGRITPYDKGCKCSDKSSCGHSGGWSIGLIQWHHGRAFDLCFEICKADANWRSYFEDKDLSLYKSLDKAVKYNSSLLIRESYGSNFHPIKGSNAYNAILKLITSTIGKQTQLTLASEDTRKSIDNLMNYYEIQNPAIIIYVADIMNQYGYYIDKTKKKAAEISKNGRSTFEQLDEMVEWCKKNLGSYNTYKTRRDRVYNYIVELDKQGKLSNNTICDIEGANQGGQFLWPCPDKPGASVTSPYGWRGAISGTTHTERNFHKGVDLGIGVGTRLIAVASGTVVYSYNDGWHGGAGKCVSIQHDNGIVTKYFHLSDASVVKAGQAVRAGDTIGYSGNTGNSSGPHLHFQLEINGNHTDPLPYIKKS